MQTLLFRRTLRQLKANIFRYLALFALIIIAMGIVVGVIGSAESIIKTVNEKADANGLEDGQFSLFVPLTEEQKTEIEKSGFTLEECFSLDFRADDDSTLRIMKNRETINRIELKNGRQAEAENEIVLERLYASAHDFSAGDEITVGGQTFTVSGIGTTSDYDLCLQHPSDMSADGNVFGTAFVTEDAYQSLLDGGKSLQTEEYRYSYHIKANGSETQLKDYLSERTSLLTFIAADDNPRIKASSDDVQINVNVGMMAGALIMILISYVISVFTVHSIDQESTIIGALYALGMKRKQLMLHYTLLPVVLCLLGGIFGTCIGNSHFMLEQMASDTVAYFSIPSIESSHSLFLILYGILLPPLAAFVVSFLTIRKRLSRTALSLLRKETNAKKHSKLRLAHMSFPRAFKLRQLLREKRSCFAMLAGIFLSLLVLILGLNCYVLCHNVEINTVADTKYAYMYQLKYPESTVPSGGYEAYIEGLTKEVLGYEMEVSIIGLTDDNPFFPSITSKKKNEISISSSVAQKYGLKKGDTLVLQEKLEESSYTFTVKEIVTYSPGLCAFMDIDSMRELFGKDDGYYNAVYSDSALDIDNDRLYAVSTKSDVEKGASIFLNTQMSLITTMVGASILIFLIVLYQMTKVMIDRSALSISLMKVFGYRSREIRSLYLDGSSLLVAIGTLVLLPLAKCLMDTVYPSFVANVACGTDFRWPPLLYVAVYFGTILVYLVIRTVLMRQLKKWKPAEVLKNRE